MSKRNYQLRHQAIVERLQEVGQVTVDELVSLLDTSAVTIRKDLQELEDQGKIIRRFGGAVLVEGESKVPDATSTASVKSRIAFAAAALIEPGSRIVLDSGATTACLVPFLEQKTGLAVMSNSLAIAQQLTELESGPTILMPGGTWDRKTQSFQGQLSEQLLRAYDFDQLFVGADGIDLSRGTTTFNELINLSRVMAEVSRQVVVLAEAKKIGRKIPNLELAWSQIQILITDDSLAASDQQQIENHGVQVITVSKGT